MSVFLHPEAFRGAVSICGHDWALGLARWEELQGKAFYLVTREKDWNREANLRMEAAFRKAGIMDTLVIAKGKREPKGFIEVFKGVGGWRPKQNRIEYKKPRAERLGTSCFRAD